MEYSQKLKQEIIDLGNSIASGIEHGECFYDTDMLKEFLDDLDRLKMYARNYFVENQKDK